MVDDPLTATEPAWLKGKDKRMAKDKDARKKDPKKKAEKTLKEKRADKKSKKSKG